MHAFRTFIEAFGPDYEPDLSPGFTPTTVSVPNDWAIWIRPNKGWWRQSFREAVVTFPTEAAAQAYIDRQLLHMDAQPMLMPAGHGEKTSPRLS